MVMKARLHEALRKSGKKQADIARDIPVSTAAVAQWFHEEKPDQFTLKHKNIIGVAKSLGVSVDWLEGRTDKASNVTSTDNNLTIPLDRSEKSGDIVHYVPDADGHAWQLTAVQSYELWAREVDKEVRGMVVLTKWVEEEGIDASKLVSIELPDDAQGPRRIKGDVVAVNMDYGQSLKNDALYAIKLGEKHTLRRVAILGNGDIMLSCSNPDYKHAEERIRKEDIQDLDILGEYFSAAIR